MNRRNFILDPIKAAAIAARTWPVFGPYPPAPDPELGIPELNPALTVMASPPVVTVGASSAATVLPGSWLIPYTDPRFRYFGTPTSAGPTSPDTNYTSPLFAKTAGLTYSTGSWGVEFETDAAQFELRVKGTGTTARYRLTVDGDGYESQAGQPGPASTGGSFLVHYDLGSSALRRLRFDFIGGVGFGGIRVPPDTLVQASTRDFGPKVILMGDSQAQGTGADAGFASYGHRLAERAGWLDLTMAGVGGTGVINPGTNVIYNDRLDDDVLDHSPDIFIVQLTGNDMAVWVDAPTYETALDLLLDNAVAGLPVGSSLIVIWPWHDTGTPTVTLLTIRDIGIQQAAAHTDRAHIDPLGGPYPYSGVLADYANVGWITGEGGIGIPGSTGNAAIYIANDSTHFSQAGHDYMGEQMAAAILDTANDLYDLLVPLSFTAPVEPTPVTPATYAEAVLATEGLFGYWRLDEAAGAVANDSGDENRDGTISGPTLGTAGLLTGDSNTAMTFDGTNDNINTISVANVGIESQVATGVVAGTGGLTMEAWFKPAAIGAQRFLMGMGIASNSTSYRMGYDAAGNPQWNANHSTTRTSAAFTFVAGTTYHYVIALNDEGPAVITRVYVNGSLVATQTESSSSLTDPNAIRIGSGANGTNFFLGVLDEVATYRVALSAATILEHYNAGLGVF